MPILEASWLSTAQSLGFTSEAEMLQHLYEEAGFSLKEIEHVIGFSYISIRRRLIMSGVELRQRGGPNRKGVRRLLAVSDSELKFTPPPQLAQRYNVHVATVFSEKRLRKATKGEATWNAILAQNSASSLPLPTSNDLPPSPDGISSSPSGSSAADPTSTSTEEGWQLETLL